MSEKNEKNAASAAPAKTFRNERNKIIVLSHPDPKNKNNTIKHRCIPSKTVTLSAEQVKLIEANALSKVMLEQLTEER